mgnify:CR=1 FL=1
MTVSVSELVPPPTPPLPVRVPVRGPWPLLLIVSVPVYVVVPSIKVVAPVGETVPEMVVAVPVVLVKLPESVPSSATVIATDDAVFDDVIADPLYVATKLLTLDGPPPADPPPPQAARMRASKRTAAKRTERMVVFTPTL